MGLPRLTLPLRVERYERVEVLSHQLKLHHQIVAACSGDGQSFCKSYVVYVLSDVNVGQCVLRLRRPDMEER